MRQKKLFQTTFSAFLLFLLVAAGTSQTVSIDNDDQTEVDARVARISFVEGDVQIRRAGSQDWESAVLNLPLVEGDEIATAFESRVEIQFDTRNFLRLAGDSSLRLTTVREDGIAVTMPQGTLSFRAFDFDKGNNFVEIDAPRSTVSVQKSGLYRIDAPGTGDELKLTVTEGGEARIYSEHSGFVLRNGKSARLYLGDDRLGEWDTENAQGYFDEWSEWVADRDKTISQRLQNAKFDKYYDRDIYGAEDLDDYGQWSDSDNYGKVWRPNQSSISVYDNWSPYRYGSWRWVSPYGWTWVNDEPWAWATSHHGRWASDNRGWFWTPYPVNRPKRSRWKPAVVTIFNVGNDVCWYPLAPRDRFDDYNRNYRQTGNRNDRNFGNSRPNGVYTTTDFTRINRNSVVAVRRDQFGRRQATVRTVSTEILRTQRTTIQTAQLPSREERRSEFRRQSQPRRNPTIENVRTGAIPRNVGTESDRQLRNERFRNRQNQPTDGRTVVVTPGTFPGNDGRPSTDSRREQPRGEPRREERREQPRTEPRREEPRVERRDQPWFDPRREDRREERREQPRVEPRREEPRVERREQPRVEPRREEPRVERREQPRVEPRREEPRVERREQPRVEPRREEPRVERREQPRVEPRREEPRVERREQPRVEPRREEPRREQPRVEPRREEPRREQPRVEPRREEPRREQPRVEPRREQPRPNPREERNGPPPSNKRPETRNIQQPEVDS